jgi:hypothetical protein
VQARARQGPKNTEASAKYLSTAHIPDLKHHQPIPGSNQRILDILMHMMNAFAPLVDRHLSHSIMINYTRGAAYNLTMAVHQTTRMHAACS